MLPGRRLRRLTSAQRLASAAATGMPPDESIDRAVSDPEKAIRLLEVVSSSLTLGWSVTHPVG